jgi:hypothetical protein
MVEPWKPCRVSLSRMNSRLSTAKRIPAAAAAIPGRRAPSHSRTTRRAASRIASLLLAHFTRSSRASEHLVVWPIAPRDRVAYSIGVRQSRKPWGYINDDSIHDIVALGDELSASAVDVSQAEKGRKGWTFRRTDNLRLWARKSYPIPSCPVHKCHFKCRSRDFLLRRSEASVYSMLPIISPATPDVPTSKPSPTAAAAAVVGPAPPPSPSTPTAKSSEMPIFFDARVVARRDDGWEDMLERTHLRWTSAVVEERRNRSR